MSMHRICIFVAGIAFLAVAGSVVQAQHGGSLRVGAARVNVTPAPDAALRMSGYGGRNEGFKGIHDSLYYRVLVFDDGRTQGALVVGDVLFIPDEWWQELAPRLEREAGIPRDNLLLAATHTHGAPQSLYRTEAPDEKLIAYTEEVAEKVVQAVKAARASLQPARMGVGRGRANVNINRTARTAEGGYWLGQNPDGPSDKTVHVLKFERLDGSPIAILVNYAVHGVVGGSRNYLVTADLPGATARLVERHYGDRVVVPWTSGAAGDQNPIYWDEEELNGDRIRALDVQGQILGEEVIRVAEGIERMTDRARIRGAQKVVTVPGKERNEYSPTGAYTFTDADSVEVRLSVLMVNTVALCGVSGEVLTGIGLRLKEASPYAETMMITHANGTSGYLPDDEAYKTPGYEIMVSRVKEGAEEAILGGLLDLLDAH